MNLRKNAAKSGRRTQISMKNIVIRDIKAFDEAEQEVFPDCRTELS